MGRGPAVYYRQWCGCVAVAAVAAVPVNHAPLITIQVLRYIITCRSRASATDQRTSSRCAVNLRTRAVNCRWFDVVSPCCFWYIIVLIFKSVELTDLKLFSFRHQLIVRCHAYAWQHYHLHKIWFSRITQANLNGSGQNFTDICRPDSNLTC